MNNFTGSGANRPLARGGDEKAIKAQFGKLLKPVKPAIRNSKTIEFFGLPL